jgi:hypothetical protein
MRFRTTVDLGGKTATGMRVPADVVAGLGSHKQPPVRVTINGYTYRSTVAVRAGQFLLPLSAENRAGAGVAAGDNVEVDVELDNEPRVVTVPDDFAAGLAGDATAKQRFDALSYSNKSRHVIAIEQARTPETRARRIEKALSTLRGD